MTTALEGGEVSASRTGRSLPRERLRNLREAGWPPGPVWTGAKNLAPTGIRSPDLPARSESLYRLSYPGPHLHNTLTFIKHFRSKPFFDSPLWDKIFPFLSDIQTGSGAQTSSYAMDTEGF